MRLLADTLTFTSGHPLPLLRAAAAEPPEAAKDL